MPKRAFIIHGWEGSPYENWFQWLKKELEAKGFRVWAPEMPDPTHPRMVAWVDRLKREVGTPDKDCYFIGHSLGCITILRYLEALGKGEEVGGAVLVAGFAASLNIDEISDFFKTPVDFEQVRQGCKGFAAINSDNDSWVPLKYGEMLKEKLGAELLLRHQGHFNDEMTELPDALDAVLAMSGSP